ncbi:PH domain-containing protein [Amorphus orientalis]|uniref:Membrane protein YdbT with pleckstrin-like domain n=1 Tax=Amorphus orientalis TaxID=649198 RepID=A0AAE3VTR0_9HYPH|nr:PH domain-containing protein [Amorphus orientalis]MDQ0317451.1 putative membrane protein YdbT with pleckstrin-like domain [Amorphus orientalis]
MPVRYQAHPSMFKSRPLTFILCVILIPLGIGIVALVVWWLIHRTTTVTVDGDRVALDRGILSKEHTEIELQSIRTVKVDQSLPDRLLNVGTLRIYTAGDRPEMEVKGLPDPEALRAALRP